MAFHLEMSEAAFRAAGHTPDESHRLALVKFGGVDRFEEEARDAMGGRRAADLAADLRYALRVLLRTPAFSIVAIGSLALGFGASATMFGIVDAVLLKPLAYPAADRLAQIGERSDSDRQASTLSLLDVQTIARESRTFEEQGAVYPEHAGFTLVDDDRAEQLRGSWVTPGALRALAVPPLIGPGLRPGDDLPGAAPVALISASLWQSRFAGAPDIVGRSIRVHGESRTIVGVMPPDFRLPGFAEQDLWLVPRFEAASERAPFVFRLIARLAPERTLADARAELGPIAKRVAAEFPGASASWQYTVTPLKDIVVGDASATIWLLAGAVALVMLIAIANAATLLIVRTMSRESELSVRVALGAGRGRIVRQLLTESAVLCIAGGAIGTLLAVGSLGAIERIGGDMLPRLHEVEATGRVVLLVMVLSLLAGVVIGLAPLIRVPNAGSGGLRARTRGGTDRGGVVRLREIFVIAEFALALAVVIAATLLVASLQRLSAVDPGSRTDGVLAVRLSLPAADYPTPELTLAFYQAVEQRIAALPGVLAVAVTMAVPPDRLVMTNPAMPAGRPVAPGEDVPAVEELLVSPDYFRTMGITLREGRSFTPDDHADAPLVTIVNEEMARRFFPGASAIGEQLQLGNPDPASPRYEIVGVAANVKYQGLDMSVEPTVYVPYAQNAWWRTMYLVVRTVGEPVELVPRVRTEVAAVDPRIPLQEVSTLDALMHDSMNAPRVRTGLLAGFAAIAMILAMTGIYGVTAYAIGQRRHEMSIRMALGARPVSVLGMVLRSGLRMAAIGAALGIGIALVLGQAMARFAFGTEPTDTNVLATSTVVLMLGALAATLGPALRAARAQPADALRAA
jgi:predicted permease